MSVEQLGKAIRELRAAAGMSQADLAARVGVTQKTISTWELGHQDGAFAALADIEAALGVLPGQTLRVAGICPEVRTTRDAILTDPSLSEIARAAVLGAYDAARKANANGQGRRRPVRRG